MQVNVNDTGYLGRGLLQSFETCANYFLPRVGEFVQVNGGIYEVVRIVHNLDEETVSLSVESTY